MRVLIVEDDALIALDMAGLVEDLGHEVIGSEAEAEAAFALARNDRPDVALVDIRLAGKADGGELAGWLYRDLGVRSLFVSGSITETFREAMADIQPLGFLGKPITFRNLGEALRDI
ncbi:response regulator [Phenylobacterium immobile]|uniref:response regulator n=1 Tax=Phenylobacterium immobile TaxID=21 RepID=UPI000A6BEC0D|nr:response regulator [Phenylobacterium immobile]